MLPVETDESCKAAAAVYEKSDMACAVVDANGTICYKNKAFVRLFGGNAPDFKGYHCYKNDVRDIVRQSELIRVNITPLNERESMLTFSVFSTGSSFFSDPAAQEYLLSLSAAVRHASAAVTAAADKLCELGAEDKANEEKRTEMLNMIDSSMLTLMSEFLIPEEIAAQTAVRFSEEETVNLSGGLSRFADDISQLLAAHPVDFSAKIDRGLYAAVNMRMLRLILTDFIVKVLDGKYVAEAIGLYLHRKGDMAAVSIAAGAAHKLPKNADMLFASQAVPKPHGCRIDPCEALTELFCRRYGCTICSIDEGGVTALGFNIPLSDDIDISSSGMNKLHIGTSFTSKPSRFSDENIMLSRFRLSPTYNKKGEKTK